MNDKLEQSVADLENPSEAQAWSVKKQVRHCLGWRGNPPTFRSARVCYENEVERRSRFDSWRKVR